MIVLGIFLRPFVIYALPGAPGGFATLDVNTLVEQDPASASATPGAGKIVRANGSGKLPAGWGGAASTLATLNSSSKVVEDPANATATPTASKIPIAGAGGQLDQGWAPGTLIGVQRINAGTTTYSPTSGTKSIVVYAQAGGGGGGGANGASAQASVGGGGASGGRVMKRYTGIGSGPYTVSVGTGGSGGTSAPADGSAGNDTTFTDGSTLITAKGGGGGAAQASGTSFDVALGGNGVLGTNGDFNGAGSNGDRSLRQNGASAWSGGGASSLYGGGGGGRSTNGAGNNGLGLGSGGGGARSLNAFGGVAGGNGANGVLEIWEYT